MGDATTSVTPLLTADQAFPAFERLFLSAQDRIFLCFRIFDPTTALRSEEGQAIGADWFDLLVHTLARGVRLNIVISDFDPIVRADYHARATRCLRWVIAAGEVSGRPDLLTAATSLHPARLGWLPSLALWPRARGNLLRTVAEINAKLPAVRRRALTEMPLLEPYFEHQADGTVRLRPFKPPRLVPVTHHQKLAVADGEVLYIGGLDLNDRRYDTPEHARPASETWHDTQVLVRGPVAAEAETHLAEFRDVTAGKRPTKMADLLRTVSRARKRPALMMSPLKVLSELAAAHTDRAGAAQDLIYLETQFFRDTRFARHIARRAREKPDLGMILILPAAPDDIAFRGNSGEDARYGEYLQAKCVKILTQAFGNRLFIGSPAQRRAVEEGGRAVHYGAPLIYLHAKVSIFDRTAAIVSSANLNGRSFYWDTEAGVTIKAAEDVDDLRRMCFAHWLSGDTSAEVDDSFTDPGIAVSSWRQRARENVRRAPKDREGYILPYASGPARRFGHNLPGIPEEMV